MITAHPTIESILLTYQTQLGSHYQKYRNHVYRVYNLTLLLAQPNDIELKALAIAAAFHDLGIWTAGTFDYLQPSVELSKSYLAQNGLQAQEALVAGIINNHHKLSGYKTDALVEAFRKADLVDLSFGMVRFGITSAQLKELNGHFPTLGFHRFILKQALKNTIKHPFNPLPMMKA